MRPSLRFLALSIIGWAGMRAATLGALPGSELFRIDRSEAKAPAIIATQFPSIEPLEPAGPWPEPASIEVGYGPGAGAIPDRANGLPSHFAGAPVSALPLRPQPYWNLAPESSRAPAFRTAIPPLEQWSLASIAGGAAPLRSTVVPVPGQSTPEALRPNPIDRLQLSTWALLRSSQAGVIGPRSLATGGQLGASQAGARLSYNVTRQIAATIRTTSEVGRRGGELAAGIRAQPLGSVPLWVTAERRQRLGRYGGGRNAFALFFEGGVYGRPMPFDFSLDAYLQGGVVGFRRRDGFVDGGLTLTRPIYRQFSAGLGVWGGAQPGVYRVDAGPRVSMRVRNNVRVHLDWRQRLSGNAAPGSGPALTLAGDF